MIKIEKTETYGWEAALRGMRNPKNSWHLGDTNWQLYYSSRDINRCIGPNDLKLMKGLANAGSDHGKYLRMINVTVDITCNQVWWAEFDTYKVGTVRNSCSKMHKIDSKPFSITDISHEGCTQVDYALEALINTMKVCERLRCDFNSTGDKKYWRALIELLPEGYNMKATVQLNYAVLKNIYRARKNHKLDEWDDFCRWVESLPYAKELICGE